MKRTKLPRIQLDEHHLPYRWQEKLKANEEIGGVFLVFLSGENQKEIKGKVKLIKGFCKTFESKIKSLATVNSLEKKETQC